MRTIFAALLVGATAHAAAPAGVAVVDLQPAAGALAAQLKLEAARASARGLKPIVEVTADWCKPCAAIKRYLNHPLMVDAFRGVALIRVDYDAWRDGDYKTAGLRVIGVPTFFELDGAGHPTGRQITSNAWGADIPANMAPTLKAFFSGAGR